MLKQPANPVTLSEEEGEGLIAHVHQSNLPAAVAGRLEQIIRTCFWLVFALQETQMTVKRLRRLLCGKGLKPSPTPEDVSAPSPTASDAPHPCAVLDADAADAAATAGEAPPDASPGPERVKPKGVTAPARGVWGRLPMWEPNASSAAMRSWRWGSVARCVGRAAFIHCLPG
jgi:hypothetical protein